MCELFFSYCIAAIVCNNSFFVFRLFLSAKMVCVSFLFFFSYCNATAVCMSSFSFFVFVF